MPKLNAPCRKRTYCYSDGMRATFHNVTVVDVSKSGYHMLDYGANEKAIVAPGWRWIELDMDEWSFKGVGAPALTGPEN